MAEFQWWLLLVGLVAGGGLVAVVTMDGRRRDEEIDDLERRAEATWIAGRLPIGSAADSDDVETVLRLHREYLGLPPPDEIVVVDASGGDADEEAHDVGDDGSRATDEDLAGA